MRHDVKHNRKSPGLISKAVFKKRAIRLLESMYVKNPGMNTDIDSYNFGIYDAIQKIKQKI